MTDAQSDELCRLSSGGGSATRQHYTNTEQVLFDACRPIFLNGIAPGITRPDLVDRCIFIRLTRASMRSERELEAAFKGIYPKVFGALCRGIQSALRHTETATVNAGVRMLDAVRWVTAGEAALGLRSGSFAEAYEQNAREAVEHLIENDVLAHAVSEFVRPGREWQGSATELFSQLEPFAPRTGRAATRWPASVQQLSARLRRLEPLVAQVGLSIDRDREMDKPRPIHAPD